MTGLKGRGSNMVAIAKSCQSRAIGAEIVCVVSQISNSEAATRAREVGLQIEVIPSKQEHYDEKLLECFARHQVDIICLAGYMKLLHESVVKAFPQRILNIHPALLPKFGGKGMYGHYVHQAVIDAHETESGCTIHFVSDKYDEGDILCQRKCPVFPDDSPETLAQRVILLEHQSYPEAIQLLWKRLNQ